MRLLFAALLSLFTLTAYAADKFDNQVDQEDRRIRVHNMTNKRITGLYATPIDNVNFKWNMLTHTGPIYAHQTMMADMDDGTGYCRYNVVAVFPNGKVAKSMGLNVCKAKDLYIYPSEDE